MTPDGDIGNIIEIYRSGRIDDALLISANLLKNDYDNSDLRYLVGIIINKKCEYDASNKVIRRLVLKIPHDPAVHTLIADNYFGMECYDLGIASLRRALKAVPNYKPALDMLDRVRARIGRDDARSYAPPIDCQIPDLARIYEETLGYRTEGRFLEIGAFDGESYSNTSFLADVGWAGVYVEPVPRYAEVCRNRHALNDVRVLQCAVGAADGDAHIEIRGVLSSLAAVYNVCLSQDDRKDGRAAAETVVTPVKSPMSLVAEIGWESVDVLSIDVEGFEWPVISGFDFDVFRPRLIILETHDGDDYPIVEIREQSRRCLRRLEACGYRVYWRDEGNVVFVR